MADNTIALQAVAPKFDPLATIQGLNTAQQGILQNKLLGQEVAGKIAKGKAFQAAINAETGAFDPVAAMKNLGSSEDGAQFAGEFAEQVQKIKTATAQGKGAEIDALGKKLDFASNWVLGMLADEKGTPITPEVFKEKFTAELLPSGLYTSKEDQAEIGAMYAQMGPDPRRNAEVLKAFVQRAKPTTMAIELTRGPITMQETGPAIVPTRVNPNTMEVQTGTPIMKGLTPGEKTETVSIIGADNAPYAVPKGEIYDAYGNLRPQEAPPNPNAPRGAIGPTALPPGVETGATEAATRAVSQLGALRTAAEAVPQNKAALTNIRDTLASFTPGPKANWTYLTGALAQQLGVAPPKVTEGVAGQEEFNKLATQFINNQMGALGGSGTDAKLASASHGSPNEFMSRLGIKNVTSLMLGLEDATAAKNSAWERWAASGNGPESYPQFVEKFNQIYNPRVFQSQYMSDAQKAAMIKDMTAAEKAQFDKDWKTAFKAGWIK